MDRMQFHDEIRKAIYDLNKEQLMAFAWLCAVRAVPYLSDGMSFRYWGNQKLKHLLGVFRAIDYCAFIHHADAAHFGATVAADAADAARVAADAAHFAADVARIAATAARFAATARFAADATTRFAAAADARVAAADAAARFATAADARFADATILKRLLDNIKIIKRDQHNQHNNDTCIYGNVWDSFMNDLKRVGCAYWADLYAKLFSKNFIMDEDDITELRRRWNVPEEIRRQGAAAVGSYMQWMADEGAERLNEARIIIVGDKGAGKTSIARKLIDPEANMPREDESTEGITVLPWSLGEDGGEKMNAHVWDFAGDAITHSVHRCFMETRCLYIYVYNGRIEHNNRPEYWLEQIRIYGGDAPVLFLVNEMDSHKPAIERHTLKDEYPSIQSFHGFDIAKDAGKLSEFREAVINKLRTNPTWCSQEMPAAAYRIKEELRDHFEKKQTDLIERDEFYKIAIRCNAVSDDYDSILGDLHILGICFRYKFASASETVVLNTAWITDGIYKIIRWGDREDKHVLTLDDGAQIFRSAEDKKRYPEDRIKFLFELMCEYELAFFKEAKQPNDPKEVVVPLLLPADRPKEMPKSSTEESLIMHFGVQKVLPPNIVPRLVVKRHSDFEDIPDSMRWRKGALLHYRRGKAEALVVEDARTVTVTVKGPDRTPYIAELRNTLRSIFRSYKGLSPDLFYKLIVPDEPIQGKPFFVKESTLKMYDQRGRPILNENTGEDVPTEPTMEAYRMKRTEVFICYARKDKSFLDELKPYLKVLDAQHGIKVWFDEAINTGDKWEKEIREHLSKAKVAVLMVSQHFLASDFINNKELPELLAAAENDDATIMWVPVAHCMVKDFVIKIESGKEMKIYDYQAVGDPEQPLESLTEKNDRNKLYLKLSDDIKRKFPKAAKTDESG